MRRSPRRPLAFLALCLVLGLLTTVLVAWGLAARLQVGRSFRREDEFLRGSGRFGMRAVEFSRPGAARRSWYLTTPSMERLWPASADRVGPPNTRILRRDWGELPDSPPPHYEPWMPIEDARGWPCLALWCSIDAGIPDNPAPLRARGGLLLSDGGTNPLRARALPARPIWRGLLANTGLYAGAWAVVLLAPGPVRRWRRRRLGGCSACGYELAGLPDAAACPECGAAPRRATRPRH